MTLTPRFSLALAFTSSLHAQQVRKGSGVPYLAHLLAVAAIAIEHGASEDEAIAALLHDAIEDQGGPAIYEEIRHRFGPQVADIVQACSDTDQSSKPPWQERKEAYLAKLPTAGPSVLLVCAADKLHNARSLVQDYRAQGESLWQHFSGGRLGTLWYYRRVTTILQTAPPGATPRALVDELDRTVSELEHLAGGSAGEFT
jgi:(p)ppGpp synthase/HD superfamily hydrolase